MVDSNSPSNSSSSFQSDRSQLPSSQSSSSSSSSLSSSSTPASSSASVGGLGSVVSVYSANPFHYGEFPHVAQRPLITPISEYCLFKSGINGVMGAGLGIVWGIFMSSMGTGVNSFALQPGMTGYIDPSSLSTKEALKLTMKDMMKASKSSAKNFGTIGAIYTLTECTIEKTRGKHDISNALAAGCITGGALAARGGPQTAAFGCVGFAVFGYVMDKFLMGNV